MKQSQEQFGEEKPKKVGFWQQYGGPSLSIAVLLHVILAILGGLWIAQRIYEPEKKIDFIPGSVGGGERGVQSKMHEKNRTQITPSTNVKRVAIEGAISKIAIPDPGDSFGEMSTLASLAGGGMSGGLGGGGSGSGFGSGQGINTGGLGMGVATGKMFGLIPETMRKRCSKEDRLARLKENGGTPACEEAVMKGLRWLKANQNPDGSWGTAPLCSAMTGLALLAYFGHCETPLSEEFGESCVKGIVYLVDVGMKNDGQLVANVTKGMPGVYIHGISTYALGEATTFCKDLKVEVPNLQEVTQKAAQYIIDNQADNGGWAYGYQKEQGSHTDTSIVGWQLQALKACTHTDMKLNGVNEAVKKGLAYLVTKQNASGGFGYIGSGGSKFPLTGVGVLCHQMWGMANTTPVKDGVKYIQDNFNLNWDTLDSDLYSHYYASQAMMQAGGTFWKSYNDIFRDQLLNNQNPDGSWKAPAFPGHGKTAKDVEEVYRNTLCILMLEVYYRFLATSGGSSGKPARSHRI